MIRRPPRSTLFPTRRSSDLAAALTETGLGKTMGVLAVALAAVNVFGGFLVTRRMLEMFRKKERKSAPAKEDRKSTRLNSSHSQISYAVFCLKKKKNNTLEQT